MDLLNNNLTEITITTDAEIELYCSQKKFKNLPNSLTKLIVECIEDISQIDNLPCSLQDLYLVGCEILKIENLPDSLLKLRLSSNEITKIENLPENLLNLHLGATSNIKS
jgi:hypothetical protein